MPPSIRRVVNIFNLLMVAILNGALIRYSIPWISKTGNYLTASLGIPKMYLQLIVPISCGIAILYCLFQIIYLFRNEKT